MPLALFLNRLRALLVFGQRITLCSVLAVSAHTYRLVLWETENRPNLYVEFRGVVLFLPDYLLMVLVVLTLLRVGSDPSFRTHLFHTTQIIFAQYGGLWWVGLALWMMCGVIWANETRLVLYSALHLSTCLGMAFLVAEFVRTEQEFGWLVTYCLAAAFQGALAVGQFMNDGPLGLEWLGEVLNRHTWPERINRDPPPAYYRGNGLTVNPNNLAGYLLVGLLAWVAVLGRQQSQRWRVPLFIVGGLISGGLLATFSRTAWLALALVGSIALLSWLRRCMPFWRAFLLLVMLIGAGSLILATSLLLVGAKMRLTSQNYLTYYGDTRTVIQLAPLVGVGAGNLMTEVSHLHVTLVENLLPAHNVFLIVRAELGLPGLFLFVLGCLAVLLKSEPAIFDGRIWLYGFFALMVVMSLDYYLWGDHRSRILFFWMLGMIWGRSIQAHDTRPDDQNSQGH